MENLRGLYKKNTAKMEQVRDSFAAETLHGPLLMELASYFRQPIKLFVVGQQTNGWRGDYKDQKSLLDEYVNFGMGKNYKGSRTPFWKFVRIIETMIGIEPYSCAWSNINKYDHKCQEPKGVILEKIQELDYLLKDEIAVIKPDICLFFVNKKYDHRLEQLYPGIEMECLNGFSKTEKEFVRLTHPLLPKYCFRTPHPKRIQLKGWRKGFLSEMNRLLPKANMNHI